MGKRKKPDVARPSDARRQQLWSFIVAAVGGVLLTSSDDSSPAAAGPAPPGQVAVHQVTAAFVAAGGVNDYDAAKRSSIAVR